MISGVFMETHELYLETGDVFVSSRSLVGLGQEDQAGQGSPPLETMLFDNDLGFFGGLCL